MITISYSAIPVLQPIRIFSIPRPTPRNPKRQLTPPPAFTTLSIENTDPNIGGGCYELPC